jgi:hypothetical protein
MNQIYKNKQTRELKYEFIPYQIIQTNLRKFQIQYS